MFKLIIPYMLSYTFIESREDIITNYHNYYIDYFIINHIIT